MNPSSSGKPKFELSVYRKFIREAGPYVSLIVGRKIAAAEADLLSDAEITKLALLIDARVQDLEAAKPKS